MVILRHRSRVEGSAPGLAASCLSSLSEDPTLVKATHLVLVTCGAMPWMSFDTLVSVVGLSNTWQTGGGG
jgi:hypothetical protein